MSRHVERHVSTRRAPFRSPGSSAGQALAAPEIFCRSEPLKRLRMSESLRCQSGCWQYGIPTQYSHYASPFWRKCTQKLKGQQVLSQCVTWVSMGHEVRKCSEEGNGVFEVSAHSAPVCLRKCWSNWAHWARAPLAQAMSGFPSSYSG